MLQLLVATAIASSVTVHVGVPAEAGSLYDIAVDGAAGQCAVHASRLSCPADGPVQLRWGPGGPWTLVGDTTLQAGDTGSVVVFADATTGAALRDAILAAPDGAALASVALRAGERVPGPWSRGALDALIARAADPRPDVRRVAVDGLVPWVRRASFDPLPPEAPSVLPAGLLVKLANDPDMRVRRRVVALLRESQSRDQTLVEARAALKALRDDPRRGVRRAATAADTSLALVSEDGAAARDAWALALARVPSAGPVGRTAANALARLRTALADDPAIDPVRAVQLVVTHHPERAWRVWSAWAHRVPFEPRAAERLLRETDGLTLPLVRAWAKQAPASFVATLSRWEPRPPHSERFTAIRLGLESVDAVEVQQWLAQP